MKKTVKKIILFVLFGILFVPGYVLADVCDNAWLSPAKLLACIYSKIVNFMRGTTPTTPPTPTTTIGGPVGGALSTIKDILDTLLPPGMFKGWSGIIIFGIIPFFGVWMIVYGFLQELRIFRKTRKLNVWLALIVAIGVFASHLYRFVVSLIFGIIGPWSIALFALLFFSGTWYFYIRRRAEWGTRAGLEVAYRENVESLRQELKEKRAIMAEMMERLAITRDPGRRASLEESIEKLKNDITSIQSRLEELKESYST